jgi:hypothetical protein
MLHCDRCAYKLHCDTPAVHDLTSKQRNCATSRWFHASLEVAVVAYCNTLQYNAVQADSARETLQACVLMKPAVAHRLWSCLLWQYVCA